MGQPFPLQVGLLRKIVEQKKAKEAQANGL